MRKLSNDELGRKSINDYSASAKTPVSLILDNVRSANNVGSIFRTSDAFLIEQIYLCGITPYPPNRDIHKTALGATDSVPWKYFDRSIDAVETLKKNHYNIYCLEQTEGCISLDTFQINPNARYAFVFGHEAKGVKQELIDQSDGAIAIPQFGTKHSFNIAVSVGIVLWDVITKGGYNK